MCIRDSCNILTLNLRGAQSSGDFARLIHTFQTWSRTHELGALCAQEHNLNPARVDDLKRLATIKGLTLVIGFAPRGQDGIHWGGSLVLINNSLLDFKSTHHISEHLVVVNVEWGGKPLQIGSVYAPVTPLARVDFFTRINQQLTTSTIAGGDWNCVVDVNVDVKSATPQTYRNIGAVSYTHLTLPTSDLV